jgi:hypothetical protein
MKSANTVANFLQDSAAAKLVVTDSLMLAYKQRRAIEVNVPTRWATGYLVLASLLKSQQALAMAINSPEWEKLSDANKKNDVRKIFNDKVFWSNASMLQELLQPFCDAIHKIEGDKPHLAECHIALMALRKHVKAWAKKHGDGARLSRTARALPTFEERLSAKPGGVQAPIHNAAYPAAHAFDPYYAEDKDGIYKPLCFLKNIWRKRMIWSQGWVVQMLLYSLPACVHKGTQGKCRHL